MGKLVLVDPAWLHIEKIPSPENLRFDATDPAEVNLLLIFSAGQLVSEINREGIFFFNQFLHGFKISSSK